MYLSAIASVSLYLAIVRVEEIIFLDYDLKVRIAEVVIFINWIEIECTMIPFYVVCTIRV